MEQRVEEQLDLDDYVGFWKRVLISFLDFLILALPTYFLNRLCVSPQSRRSRRFHFYSVCAADRLQCVHGCQIWRHSGQTASGGKNY